MSGYRYGDAVYDPGSPPERPRIPECPECGCDNMFWDYDHYVCRCFVDPNGDCHQKLPDSFSDQDVDDVYDKKIVNGWGRCEGVEYVE